MTIGEAAKDYGYSRRTLLDAVRRGAIRSQRAGRMYLLVEEDVAAYQQRTGHKRGRPSGSKDSAPRGPRRRASPQQPPEVDQ